MNLVKTKIVSDKTGMTIYMWRKTWWIFGYWYPFGHTSRNYPSTIINDDSVSQVLFDVFLSK